MAQCVPFLKVKDLDATMAWYGNIGFMCTATNHIWEAPQDYGLNWAEMAWQEATFMLGIDEEEGISEKKNISLWFNVDSVDEIIDNLKSKNIPMNIEPETFYGRKVVSFVDLNGFDISFFCALVR
ncbi:glyoxalase/bleomycin resistance/extradiol dioxygenase family protein [Emticicia sp. C21]|uniref:VOC family protein n=1 Tax=Emticicia sp. C21 TaxID=2302915 RepID=UPI000E34FE8C|nr:VOC family protein [Emticicia sp. C21]RFS16025.1 hypothetical protein D0T08_14115 [Emticicia sp. C21]